METQVSRQARIQAVEDRVRLAQRALEDAQAKQADAEAVLAKDKAVYFASARAYRADIDDAKKRGNRRLYEQYCRERDKALQLANELLDGHPGWARLRCMTACVEEAQQDRYVALAEREAVKL